MTLKRSVILFNILLALLLAALFWRNMAELDDVSAAAVKSRHRALPAWEKRTPQRMETIGNLFGLRNPKEDGGQADIAGDGSVQEVQGPTHLIRLRGIMVTASQRIAVLELVDRSAKKGKTAQGEARNVRVGDEILSFEVRKIESDRVLLYKRETGESIPLVIFKQSTTEG